MIARVAGRYDLSPKRLAADTAYGTGRLLRWLTDLDITPHPGMGQVAAEE